MLRLLATKGQAFAPKAAWPVLIFAVALAVRWPYLWDVPRLTDETQEVLRSLAIVRGAVLPLTNHDPYIGALFNYLLAGGFLLFGHNPYWPRLMVVLFSAATAALVYYWGRDMGGWRVGALAGVLLALSVGDTYASTHVAYSNSLTPFFLTLALFLLNRAVSNQKPVALVLAGLVAGMAFQTHPSAASILFGVSLWFLVAERNWLRTPWPYAACAGFLFGSANLLLYHLLSGGADLRRDMHLTWASYQSGVFHELTTLRGMIAGNITVDCSGWVKWPPIENLLQLIAGNPSPNNVMHMAVSLFFEWLFPLATLGGLAIAVVHRRWLLPVAVASWVALFPLYNTQLEFLMRYNAIVLPTLFVGVALLAEKCWRWLAEQRGQWAVIAAAAPMVTVMVTNLALMYCASDLRAQKEPSNRQMYQVATIAAAHTQPGEMVMMDATMYSGRPQDESYEARTLGYFLTFFGVANNERLFTHAELSRVINGDTGQLLLVEPAKINGLMQDFVVNVLPESEGLLASASSGNATPLVTRLWRKPVEVPHDATRVGISLDGRIDLLAYRLSADHISADQLLTVTLYWRRSGPVEEDYTVFVQLMGHKDAIIAQQDNPPLTAPTSKWALNEIVAEEYKLPLKDGVSPGAARILVGMYSWPSVKRLPITPANGVEVQDDAMVLPGYIRVQSRG